ncbi:MAG: hypothetical protein CME38_01435 [Haliea sp.]|nr:hypothetical protein [Haliea sp.]|tara:strand:- start:3173 stop:3361 length:189 start_codon:yes stop_codon:yes gene_type:complete
MIRRHLSEIRRAFASGSLAIGHALDRLNEWMGDEQVQRDMDTLFALAGGAMAFAFCLLVVGG